MSSNVDGIRLLALSAAGAATYVSPDQDNVNWQGVTVVSDLTVAGGTPTATITVQGKDPVSGKYYTLIASSAITATATNVLHVHPGSTGAANSVGALPLPKTWRVQAAVSGGTPSYTGTISAAMIG